MVFDLSHWGQKSLEHSNEASDIFEEWGSVISDFKNQRPQILSSLKPWIHLTSLYFILKKKCVATVISLASILPFCFCPRPREVLVGGYLDYGIARLTWLLKVLFCNISNCSTLVGYRSESLRPLLRLYYFFHLLNDRGFISI